MTNRAPVVRGAVADGPMAFGCSCPSVVSPLEIEVGLPEQDLLRPRHHSRDPRILRGNRLPSDLPRGRRSREAAGSGRHGASVEQPGRSTLFPISSGYMSSLGRGTSSGVRFRGYRPDQFSPRSARTRATTAVGSPK